MLTDPVDEIVNAPLEPFVSTYRAPAAAPSTETAPLSVCPGKYARSAPWLPRCAVAKVVPAERRVTAEAALNVRSPFTVTPASRLFVLAPMINVVPLAKLIVPPLIAPPLSVHEPV